MALYHSDFIHFSCFQNSFMLWEVLILYLFLLLNDNPFVSTSHCIYPWVRELLGLFYSREVRWKEKEARPGSKASTPTSRTHVKGKSCTRQVHSVSMEEGRNQEMTGEPLTFPALWLTSTYGNAPSTATFINIRSMYPNSSYLFRDTITWKFHVCHTPIRVC